tara:strand:+ start:1808 stop:2011 length:204 start_codon:yes stop_codon:yes gene_type:complete
METALFETLQEIHRNEQQANGTIDPCFECGESSEQFGEFADGDFVCEACAEEDEIELFDQLFETMEA